MAARSLFFTFLLSHTIVLFQARLTYAAAAPLFGGHLNVGDDYAPAPTTCPTSPLVRSANGISSDEAHYYASRKPNADQSLSAWLAKQGKFSTSSQPSIALTASGGGYRAFLEAAGIIQALDGRDSNVGTSGLYQGLTYEGGLSGGSWFLSSFSGNNWPTISSLRDNLWEEAFEKSPLLPRDFGESAEDVEILADLAAKKAAGYHLTIIDIYGRLLSYQFLHGHEGGHGTRLSTLTTFSNFTSFNVPYPIITTRGDDRSYSGQCFPSLNATQYEFHPYEYGSWDNGVAAFARTQYMGTNITNGQPTTDGRCVEQYDNLEYVFGTSSDVWNGICLGLNSSGIRSDVEKFLVDILKKTSSKEPSFQDFFGIYPNPFYQLPQSTTVSQFPLLTMSDGGEAGQNVPIWPFIQPSRSIDVLIACDNSADAHDNFPNGTDLRQTYINAQAANLNKMPYIPDAGTFVSQGLNKRATFFGCNETDKIFIVYLPNVDYTFASNQSTYKVQYSKEETRGMIDNGFAIATQNGTEGWPFCLACGIKNKDGAQLPDGCNACFQKYCYYEQGNATSGQFSNNTSSSHS